MNDHASTDISYFEYRHQNWFIQTVEDDFNSGKNPELEQTDLSKDHTKGDEDSTSTEICKDKLNNINIDFVEVINDQKVSFFICFVVVIVWHDLMPESSAQYCDLNTPGSNQEVESNWSPTVTFQENHKKAKTNEDHDMNILEQRIVIVHMVLSFFFHLKWSFWTDSVSILDKEAVE